MAPTRRLHTRNKRRRWWPHLVLLQFPCMGMKSDEYNDCTAPIHHWPEFRLSHLGCCLTVQPFHHLHPSCSTFFNYLTLRPKRNNNKKDYFLLCHHKGHQYDYEEPNNMTIKPTTPTICNLADHPHSESNTTIPTISLAVPKQ
jgi:hypothetical protein